MLGRAARISSRVVLIGSFFAAGLIYSIGFVSVLLDAKPMVVTSASMEPAVSQGDALIVRYANTESIEIGDIITFQKYGSRTPTTHRVIEIRENGEGRFFKTKGDNNPTPDHDLTPAGAVLGEVTAVLPRIGYLLGFAARPQGALLAISIPLLIMLVQEILIFSAKRRIRQNGEGNMGGFESR